MLGRILLLRVCICLVQITLCAHAEQGNCQFISSDELLQSSHQYGRGSELHFSNRGDSKLDIFLVDQSRGETLVGMLNSWMELG